MARPAKTCKIKVSDGIYAQWLVNERPEEWQWQGNQAVQRFALAGEYQAPKGFKGKGNHLVGIYEPVKV